MMNTSLTSSSGQDRPLPWAVGKLQPEYATAGRELMTLAELATMPGDRCILQLWGLPPFYSRKYDLKQHPNYRYTADLTAFPVFACGESRVRNQQTAFALNLLWGLLRSRGYFVLDLCGLVGVEVVG